MTTTTQTRGRPPKTLSRNGAPSLIVELLEDARPAWFTVEGIISRCELSRPGISPAAVRRAVWRLVAQGWLETRTAHDVEYDAVRTGGKPNTVSLFRGVYDSWESPLWVTDDRRK